MRPIVNGLWWANFCGLVAYLAYTGAYGVMVVALIVATAFVVFIQRETR